MDIPGYSFRVKNKWSKSFDHFGFYITIMTE